MRVERSIVWSRVGAGLRLGLGLKQLGEGAVGEGMVISGTGDICSASSTFSSNSCQKEAAEFW